MREEINIVRDQISKENRNKSALAERIKRYHNFKDILVELNQNLSLDYIAENLSGIAFSLVARNKGNCLLFVTDKKEKLKLSLFKSKKEDQGLIIKEKVGDIFDLWVLRHSSPLLIEDIKKDFRFDSEKLQSRHARPIGSLISSPLVSEDAFLGVLRLDNPNSGIYSQEDLLFLVSICDLGAVALENGELFGKTQELAIHDGLTYLFRKEYFLERLKEECARGLRQKESFSLLMLDIDYFKNYNDRFGHTAGDIVLRSLSQDILESLRDYNPIVGRFGGEEFCVILPFIAKNKAYAIANDLRAKIENRKIDLRRQTSSITISIGIAGFPVDGRDEKELIFKADKAMYTAKNSGRNKVINA